MANHNKLGRDGELAAGEYLISKGFIIRDMNWRVGKLEIDIVAQDPFANILHIIEVKTRSRNDHFDPMESITRAKIRNLVNAANSYITYYQIKMALQFDVMIIVGQSPDFEIHFIPDAFRAPLKTVR